MKIQLRFLASAILLLSTLCLSAAAAVSPSVILPRPVSVELLKGEFTLPVDGIRYSITGAEDESLRSYISEAEPSWQAATPKKANLLISISPKYKTTVKASPTNPTAVDEAYTLKITPKKIEISAATRQGAFYALQSLRQMVREGSTLQAAVIDDAPRFRWRGIHFDVSRHFRDVDFLRRQIDAMASLKLNRAHLHLTDGAGWRMEIDSFPRLTTYAAWRPELKWSDWRDNGARYCDRSDPRAAGGFYTKQQMRDLVEYAARRGILVVPEIEMPGHSDEVLAAYPELACTDSVTLAPVMSGDLCPGKEATYRFLEDVLNETMDVFPSEYIHIGGDEASKGAWKNCPDCQSLMKREGLKDVDELQSYLIKRMERFVNSKGRHIIGWDEILQGGVAPNATVMSWRGTEGGLQSIAEGHDVIMTPGNYCYLDHGQDAPFREPASAGGYLPLEKVYLYEPLDSAIAPDKAHHLLGLQGNLWTEHVVTDSHAEYMYYPRAFAIAEIGWSPAEKDYPDFRRRSLKAIDRMRQDGYTTFDLAHEYGNRPEAADTVRHLAYGAPVSYAIPYRQQYAAAGDATMTDGLRGGWNNNDGRWQGFLGDVDLTVDLGSPQTVHYVTTTFLHSEGAWIHLPENVKISLSEDGKTFREVGTVYVDVDPKYPKVLYKDYGVAVDNLPARYIKIQAQANPRPGSWLFLDEVIVK